MMKIPDAIREIINKNPLLKFGISNKLFNLTQLSKTILPQVKALTKKEVQETAVLMGLSRLQKQFAKTASCLEDTKIENITVHSNLCALTFPKTNEIRKKINSLSGSYITITEGINEITIILKESSREEAKKIIGEEPINEHKKISSIGIKFPEKFNRTPGFIYLVLQQLFLQHINLVEISSTYTDLFLYIEEKDVKLAFDTLVYGFEFE